VIYTPDIQQYNLPPRVFYFFCYIIQIVPEIGEKDTFKKAIVLMNIRFVDTIPVVV
jgi:hypothetical protein